MATILQYLVYGLQLGSVYALLALGVLLLFLCIPCWAWLALLGLGLIVAGALLLRLSKAWR